MGAAGEPGEKVIRRERTDLVELVRIEAPPLHLIGQQLTGALRETFEDLRRDPPRAVALQCWGGGADVREMVELTPASARTFIGDLHAACAAIRNLDAPVIAVIDGPCLGAYLEVAAACDLRVCSPDAVLGMPEVRVGIPSVIDACWLLLHCGVAEATRLVMDGEVVDAAEGRRIGLVHRVAPAPWDEAVAWARTLARLSPVALRQQKRVLRDWTQAWYEEAARTSIDRFVETFEHGEAQEAMRAFLEKREPTF